MMKSAPVLLTILLLAVTGCQETSNLPASNSLHHAPSSSSLKPLAEDIVRRQLNDSSAYLRVNAIEVTVETGQRQLVSLITERLKDPSVAVRFAAALALGDMKCIPCEYDLVPLLKDENHNVRIAAAYSLTRLGNVQYTDEIYKAVRSTDETVRANAVLLIGKMGNREDLPLLYEIMRDSWASEKVRFQAVESIARLGDIQIYRSKLWPMLISKYADDRVMGIRGMGALGSYEAQVAVQTMLKDEVLEVRLTAAEQLGRMNDKAGKDEVVRFFAAKPDLSQPTMANQMAILAVGRIGGEDLEGYLGDALASPSKLIQLVGAESVLLLNRQEPRLTQQHR